VAYYFWATLYIYRQVYGVRFPRVLFPNYYYYFVIVVYRKYIMNKQRTDCVEK